MEYLHEFATQAQLATYKESEIYQEPFIGLVNETGGIGYNKNPLETPLTLVISSPGTINWFANNTAATRTIEYKLNNGEWTSITSATGTSCPKINVVKDDKVKFRGNNITYGNVLGNCSTFSGSTAEFDIEGNIMSLIDSENFAVRTILFSGYTFYALFKACTGLTSAENLLLPATNLAERCYDYMFSGCTNLTTAPIELPATKLEERCYEGMFFKCESFTTVPNLPATTLAKGCYSEMFCGCSSLESVPSNYLHATNLAEFCYANMFVNCTSLTTAPELPATTLVKACYDYMFCGCTGLTTAPDLLAPTLAERCYEYMFYACSSLNYVKCLATNISASSSRYFWLENVSSTGTFVKHQSMTWPTTGGRNSYPYNWTVEDAS